MGEAGEATFTLSHRGLGQPPNLEADSLSLARFYESREFQERQGCGAVGLLPGLLSPVMGCRVTWVFHCHLRRVSAEPNSLAHPGLGTCFWSLANRASFAPRSVFLSSFPWSSSIGQLLRVLTRPGVGPRWDESVAAQGQRPSRSGVSCPGLSLHVLLPARAARDSCPLVLCFHPSGLIVGTHPTWAQALPTFSFLSPSPGTRWNGRLASAKLPLVFTTWKRGEAFFVAQGDPPGPPGPEDWGQLWV